MATIKEELSAIAEGQGYEGEAPKTIAQAVNALGTVIGGGSGGAEPLVVRFTMTSETEASADKTFTEVSDAVVAGRQVVGVGAWSNDYSDVHVAPLVRFRSGYYADFSAVDFDTTDTAKTGVVGFHFHYSGTVTWAKKYVKFS